MVLHQKTEDLKFSKENGGSLPQHQITRRKHKEYILARMATQKVIEFASPVVGTSFCFSLFCLMCFVLSTFVVRFKKKNISEIKKTPFK
jgi:hypothetical protein